MLALKKAESFKAQPGGMLYASYLSDFGQVLQERRRCQPEKVAYRLMHGPQHSEAVISYRDLDGAANRIAAKLAAEDTLGRPVLLLLPPGLDYIAAFFGCLYAGAIAVPMYPPRLNRSFSRLESVIADAQPAACLTNRRVLAMVHTSPQETAIAGLRLTCVDSNEPEAAKHFERPRVGRETIALLQYTSGSTTDPRGVMVTHGNLLHNSSLIQECFGHTDQSCFVSWLPPYHDMGLVAGILQPLFAGCTGVLMPPAAFLHKPLRWLQALSQEKATHTGAPNFAYELCTHRISTDERDSLDLSSLRVAACGSEPIRADVVEEFAEFFGPCGFRRESFRACYGLAEATLMVSAEGRPLPPLIKSFDPTELQRSRVVEWNGSPQCHPHPMVGCGSVRPGAEVMIVSEESGLPCRADEVGEIWVAGQSVAQGYWKRPQETAESFRARLPNSIDRCFLRTGDLGFLKEGQLFVTGRKKELIIIRGRNYYPQDLEATVVRSCPDLRTAPGAAFMTTEAAPDAVQEILVIVQELPRRHASWPREELDGLISAIRHGISEEHELTVDTIVLTEPLAIPKTSSGKIQRVACRDAYAHGTLKVIRSWTADREERPLHPALAQLEQRIRRRPTAGSLRAWLVLRVAQLTGVSSTEIDHKTPLSQCGLDSLATVTITGELESLLGVKLIPTLVWDHPSITDLAAYLAAQVQVKAVRLED